MTKAERNAAIIYYVTGKGMKPSYAILRALIEAGYLNAAGEVTAKGQDVYTQLRQGGLA